MMDQGMDQARIDADRERRLAGLVARLPEWMRGRIAWLRRPQARWIRIPAGLLLIAGGFLAILPVFGLWMLPLGLVLLAEDVPPLRRLTGRALAWIERDHPGWLAPPDPPRRPDPLHQGSPR